MRVGVRLLLKIAKHWLRRSPTSKRVVLSPEVSAEVRGHSSHFPVYCVIPTCEGMAAGPNLRLCAVHIEAATRAELAEIADKNYALPYVAHAVGAVLLRARKATSN